MSEDMERFFEDIFKKFNKDISDRIFLMIQNDRELMEKYLDLVSGSDQETVNQEIVEAINARYELEYKGKNYEPESTLIKYYEEH
ncbi:MAG: hypothetical protein ACQEQG_10755 [Bacillota bacterium]